MNKSQEEYVRNHFGKMGVKELASDTEASLSDVKKFIKTLDVRVEPPKTYFHTEGDKIVAMTTAQSDKDDKMDYMKGVKKPKSSCVFVMDPNKPVR